MSSISTFIQISTPLNGLFIFSPQNSPMRCDLHVHTIASGMFTAPVLDRICRESYNDPHEVYNLLKQRGMSVVTVTDHDSIEAAESLRGHPDFFLSEEVTVQMPSGTEMHLGVYGLTERDHVEVQRRRKDFISLLMYLTERKLFFSANHIFSGLTGRREDEDFRWFESYVPAYETRNGKMWKAANAGAEKLAKRLGKIGVAGSDSHAMFGVGLTYTEVPGARTVDEFFAGLRARQGRVHGLHGTCTGLTVEALSVVKSLFMDKPWTLALAPFALLVPVFTLNHWVNEIRFCKKWAAVMESAAGRKRKLWEIDAKLEANWAS
jgi:predicted metal-dependent phosphoesterase TrpH